MKIFLINTNINKYKFVDLHKKPSVFRNNNFKRDKVSFGNEDLVWDYTYPMSLIKHEENIENTSIDWVENYFANMSIPASFRTGDAYTNKFVAFSCFHASEIFRQMKFQLPARIELFDFRLIKNSPNAQTALGVCFLTSDINLGLPLRTVAFNTYSDPEFTKYMLSNIKNTRIGSENFPIKDDTNYWKNHFIAQKNSKRTDFGSTGHFLHPFIHEFCHNLHFNQIYKNYGCPELNPQYRYNPSAVNILASMNIPINDEDKVDIYHPLNSFVTDTARKSIKNSSFYGATLLPELFAEELTRTILDNIDLFSLRLKQSIYPFASSNPTLSSVLYEVYNGLINDGQGLV